MQKSDLTAIFSTVCMQAAVPDCSQAFVLDFILRHKQVKGAIEGYKRKQAALQPEKRNKTQEVSKAKTSQVFIKPKTLGQSASLKEGHPSRERNDSKQALKNRKQSETVQLKQKPGILAKAHNSFIPSEEVAKSPEQESHQTPVDNLSQDKIEADISKEVKELPRKVSNVTNIGGGVYSLGSGGLVGPRNYLVHEAWHKGLKKQQSEQLARSQIYLQSILNSKEKKAAESPFLSPAGPQNSHRSKPMIPPNPSPPLYTSATAQHPFAKASESQPFHYNQPLPTPSVPSAFGHQYNGGSHPDGTGIYLQMLMMLLCGFLGYAFSSSIIKAHSNGDIEIHVEASDLQFQQQRCTALKHHAEYRPCTSSRICKLLA